MLSNVNRYDVKFTIEKLLQIPNIFLIAETIGKYDIIAFAAFRNLKEVKKIVNEIRAQPSVKK